MCGPNQKRYIQFILGVMEGIMNYTRESLAPSQRAMEDRHTHISIVTIKPSCSRSRGMPSSRLHGELLLLLGIL